jgi:hypothetical protein
VDFAPIPPTHDLKKYLSSRKTWFALAQENDRAYEEFYEKAPDDVTVILDNGAYEGKMILELFQAKIHYFEPEVVILPDLYLGAADKSLHLSLGFLEQCGLSSQPYTNEWMFVPQAEPGDVDGFVRSLFTALKDERITWIGIPRCLATDISDSPLARVGLARAILKDYPKIKIHALGMVNGCIPELYYLQEAGVSSCDSSWPFNHGNTDENLRRIDECLNTQLES